MTSQLCDANVWIALSISGHRGHLKALRWWDTVSGPAGVVVCRATQQAYLRLMTNAAVFAPYASAPLTNNEAWAAFEAIAADERVVVRTAEPDDLTAQWRRLAAREVASPKLWMDAYLAAYAITGGYRLITSDAAFVQFDGLDLTVV